MEHKTMREHVANVIGSELRNGALSGSLYLPDGGELMIECEDQVPAALKTEIVTFRVLDADAEQATKRVVDGHRGVHEQAPEPVWHRYRLKLEEIN